MILALYWPGGTRRSTPLIVLVCSVVGLRFVFKGIRNEILDADGIEKAPRWVYLATGAALQIPAILYAYVVNRANQ